MLLRIVLATPCQGDDVIDHVTRPAVGMPRLADVQNQLELQAMYGNEWPESRKSIVADHQRQSAFEPGNADRQRVIIVRQGDGKRLGETSHTDTAAFRADLLRQKIPRHAYDQVVDREHLLNGALHLAGLVERVDEQRLLRLRPNGPAQQDLNRPGSALDPHGKILIFKTEGVHEPQIVGEPVLPVSAEEGPGEQRRPSAVQVRLPDDGRDGFGRLFQGSSRFSLDIAPPYAYPMAGRFRLWQKNAAQR